MTQKHIKQILATSRSDKAFPDSLAEEILAPDKIELLSLLSAAFKIRYKYFKRDVLIHIIDNVQNGQCSEDCRYCAQSNTSTANIEKYPFKTDEEILHEARVAYELGAFRHCLVLSGKKLNPAHIKRVTRIVKEIKRRYPIQVCVSPGLLDQDAAKKLKKAGLDRINHNINTSRRLYPEICTTHTYEERLGTLRAANAAKLQICSGVIIGMGETVNDIIQMAQTLRQFKAASVPVNFFLPIDGTAFKPKKSFTPDYCLRILCLFRFLNPKVDLRIAAGREAYLGSLEALSLYPANSLFLDGYLNTKGTARLKTFRMIKEAGFTIKSDIPLNKLIDNETQKKMEEENPLALKNLGNLRPLQQTTH